MRNIYVDLSSDNPLQQPKIFGGYDGEHNETFLRVKLPKRMIEAKCTGYRFDFQISKDNITHSPLIPTSELNDDIISFHLPEQLTNLGDLFFNVAAITLDGDIISSIGKASGAFIRINNSPKGKVQLIDPNGYKDELLKMVDERIFEISPPVISPPVIIDQNFDPESENAQSGKAVAEAISSIEVPGGGVIEIDQNFNPESENAQSGKAVAEAINEKLGDIETALDELHNYAQAIIGGA